MNTAWLDRTNPPLRAIALLAAATGYLLVIRGPEELTALDWALVVAASAASMAGRRWPLAVALSQTGLLLIAEQAGAASAIALKVSASIALFELALRRSGWPLAAGAGALVAVYAVHVPADPAGLVFRAIVVIGGPLLLGAHLRALVEQQRRQRALEVRDARTAERTAIARELHDLVAHHVASMVLRTEAARHALSAGIGAADARVREVLDDLHRTGNSALEDLQRLVIVLRETHDRPPESLVDGLVDTARLPEAVQAAVERSRRVGLHIEASLDPAIAELDTVRGLTVLRLTQEGLTNVVKHAGPGARARIAMSVTGDNAVRLEIRDEGGGGGHGPGGGHGLIGMRERVELLGGTFDAGSVGTGWRLLAVLPA